MSSAKDKFKFASKSVASGLEGAGNSLFSVAKAATSGLEGASKSVVSVAKAATHGLEDAGKSVVSVAKAATHELTDAGKSVASVALNPFQLESLDLKAQRKALTAAHATLIDKHKEYLKGQAEIAEIVNIKVRNDYDIIKYVNKIAEPDQNVVARVAFQDIVDNLKRTNVSLETVIEELNNKLGVYVSEASKNSGEKVVNFPILVTTEYFDAKTAEYHAEMKKLNDRLDELKKWW
jgi:hypothetical protein